jgi:hypothetical protein
VRAALALEDAELLAAADMLARRGGPGWAAQSIAATVARARSDTRMERAAIAGFRAAAETLIDPVETAAALASAATLLDGALARGPEATALAAWVVRRLGELTPTDSSSSRDADLEPQLVFVALSLGKSGVTDVSADLPARLEVLGERHASDVWLWALAHDVLAEDRFRALAVAADLPRPPLMRGLALLRLHQMTGDLRYVREAGRVVANAPRACLLPLDAALLVAELHAPERAVPPPWARASNR